MPKAPPRGSGCANCSRSVPFVDCLPERMGSARCIIKIWQHGSKQVHAPQGTGSWPWPPHGWQRTIRFSASHPPLIAPCLSSACTAYSLHEGAKRQVGGRMRLGPHCQALAIQISGYFIFSPSLPRPCRAPKNERPASDGAASACRPCPQRRGPGLRPARRPAQRNRARSRHRAR